MTGRRPGCTCGCHEAPPHPNGGMNDNRVPPGAPDGGQFAPGGTLEAPVVLRPPAQDGTFHYPPVFKSAQELVDFYWSTAEVPEEVLPRMQDAYEAHKAAVVEEQMTAWDQANPEPEEGVFRKGSKAQWQSAREQAARGAHAAFPSPAIEDRWARPLARCMRMNMWCQTLPDLERAKFDALTFEMPNGKSYTADRLCRDFRVAKWGNAINYQADGNDDGWQERQLLVGINRSLGRINQSIHDTNQQVANLHQQVYEGQLDGND